MRGPPETVSQILERARSIACQVQARRRVPISYKTAVGCASPAPEHLPSLRRQTWPACAGVVACLKHPRSRRTFAPPTPAAGRKPTPKPLASSWAGAVDVRFEFQHALQCQNRHSSAKLKQPQWSGFVRDSKYIPDRRVNFGVKIESLRQQLIPAAIEDGSYWSRRWYLNDPILTAGVICLFRSFRPYE